MRLSASESAKSDNKYLLDRQAINVAYSLVNTTQREDNMTYKLLGVGTNAKTIKGDGSEYLTAILYMTPYKVMVDGKSFNSCAMAEQASCIDACLYTAGRGKFSNVQSARQRKAQWFYKDRDSFGWCRCWYRNNFWKLFIRCDEKSIGSTKTISKFTFRFRAC